MATRGAWQLKQLTIRYCQYGGSSRNVREMLRSDRFRQFVEANPQVQFQTEIKSARHPIVIGDYVSDHRKVCDVKNQDIESVMKQIERMRNTSGRKMTKLKKPVVTEKPTFQGIWQQDMEFPEFTIEHQ